MKKNLFTVGTALLTCLSSTIYAQAPTFEWGSASHRVMYQTTDMARNIYAYHSFSGTVTVGSATLDAANGDYYLAKYSPTGDMLWHSQSKLYPYHLQYANGNIYFWGAADAGEDTDFGAGSNPASETGAVFVKMDTSANQLASFVSTAFRTSARMYYFDIDGAGNTYITGRTLTTTDMNPGAGIDSLNDNTYYLAKYDANGNYLYSTGIGPAGAVEIYAPISEYNHSYVFFLLYDSLVINGTTYQGDPMAGISYIAKFNSADGAISWVRPAAGGVESYPLGAHIGQNGGIKIAMEVRTNSAATDYDPSGSTFTLTHQNARELTFISFDAQGGFITAARSNFNNSISVLDGGGSVKFDGYGNCYALFTGIPAGTYNFNLDASTSTVTLAENDAVLLKYTTDLQLSFLEVSEFAASDGGLDIDNQGDLIVSVRPQSAPAANYDVDFTAGTLNVSLSGANGANDAALTKYSQSTFVGVAQNQASNAIRVYPNPAADLLNIESATIGEQVRIVDALGRQVLATQITANMTQVSISGLANGVYLLQVGQNQAQKLIIAK